MNRMIRAAAAAVVLAGGLGSVGCVHSGGPSIEDRYRNYVDPCYPERYNHMARLEVVAPFAQQVHNGHVMNQTVYNWYFEAGSDKLTPAGVEKLDSLARVRPVPDAKIYIQTARDIVVTAENTGKIADLRANLDAKRGAAIQKYMAEQPAFGTAVAYEVYVHDPVVPGINSDFASFAYRGSLRGYRGGVSGGGTGSLSTGGGTNINAVPALIGGGGVGTGTGTGTGVGIGGASTGTGVGTGTGVRP